MCLLHFVALYSKAVIKFATLYVICHRDSVPLYTSHTIVFRASKIYNELHSTCIYVYKYLLLCQGLLEKEQRRYYRLLCEHIVKGQLAYLIKASI